MTITTGPVGREDARAMSDQVARCANQIRVRAIELAPDTTRPRPAQDALLKGTGRQLWALLATRPTPGVFHATAVEILQAHLDAWEDAVDQDEITRLTALSSLIACLPGARASVEGHPTV